MKGIGQNAPTLKGIIIVSAVIVVAVVAFGMFKGCSTDEARDILVPKEDPPKSKGKAKALPVAIFDGPDVFKPTDERDMKWATGGVCRDELDCTLASQNYCVGRGGVMNMQYRGRDTGDFACETTCMDGFAGHTPCEVKPRPDGGSSGSKEDPPAPPNCDPDIVGPPDPRCEDDCPEGSVCT